METAGYAGGLVISLAGHDKNQIFFILKEEGEYVYLADGNNRTTARPKKKKKIHVMSVPEYSKTGDLEQKLWNKDAAQMNDVEIKYLIKCYKRQVVRR